MNSSNFSSISQILGIDQFATELKDLGNLNEIHCELLVQNLRLVWRIHPALEYVPTYVFVESNLSQDLAAYIEQSVKSRLNQPVRFVQQYDNQGRLLPGVLTKHKSNLVSYFKRTVDEGRLSLAMQVASVADVLRSKVNHCLMLPFPDQRNAKKTVTELLKQIKSFTEFRRGTKRSFSGKSKNQQDDLVMAMIIAVAWARLPSNMYTLK